MIRKKTAYIFPGQGSQFPGMGRDLYKGDAWARDLFERANSILGFRITDIMFEGTAEDLRRTDVTQPAVFLHSAVQTACIRNFKPDMVAGHSLGEFSALVAAGALEFEEGLRLVAARAAAMHEACERRQGTMAVVIGLPAYAVEEICSKCGGTVVAANYNSERQIVISGECEAVSEAGIRAKKEGGRVLLLSVEGAFHSPLMEVASGKLAEAVKETPLKVPSCPIYQNVTGLPTTDLTEIRENLLPQLTSPVLWEATVRNMQSDGAEEFIELGPGTVLTGLIKTAKRV